MQKQNENAKQKPNFIIFFIIHFQNEKHPKWQFWDPGGVKFESLCNFSIVGCQWPVKCLLGFYTERCWLP